MPISPPTPDEIVSVLKKTSLPSIIVEGDDEVIIYRWLEDILGTFNANVLPCGGRSALLEVFSRRHEFDKSKTVFLADRDMWLFTSIPSNLSSIIWTTGYSIENDLYSSSLEIIEKLLTLEEKSERDRIIRCLARWFAFEVEVYKSGNTCNINFHINHILTSDKQDLRASFLEERGFTDPSASTYQDVYENYYLKLRGKMLFQVLLFMLSSNKRKSKYSRENLLEMCLKLGDGEPYFNKIISGIRAAL
jgi:hypothetical protein